MRADARRLCEAVTMNPNSKPSRYSTRKDVAAAGTHPCRRTCCSIGSKSLTGLCVGDGMRYALVLDSQIRHTSRYMPRRMGAPISVRMRED